MSFQGEVSPTSTKLAETSTKVQHAKVQHVGVFLSVKEAASKLGKTPMTITRWCESGKLPATPKPYGKKVTWLISPQALELVAKVEAIKEEADKAEKSKPKVRMPHGDYQKAWVHAMAKGTLNGKVYSKRTIDDYCHYLDLYLSRYSNLSTENVKKELMAIPAKMFAKREKYYKALLCFAKFLTQENALDSGFLEELKPLFPKRHLPPKRFTIDETDQRRAPKASRSAELFVIWTKINHLRLESTNGKPVELTREQRLAVFDKCHEIQTVSYAHIRKIVGEAIDGAFASYTFKGLLYSFNKKTKIRAGKQKGSETAFEENLTFEEMIIETEKKPFIEMRGFHSLKEVFDIDKNNFREQLAKLDVTLWDKIVSILTYETDAEMAKKRLAEECTTLTTGQIEKLSDINTFRGTVGLSVKAITKILPYLIQGETYDKACCLASYTIYPY